MSETKQMQANQRLLPEKEGSLLVVNLRGLVNARAPVLKTLGQLKLLRRFNATIVPNDAVFRGMLQSAKEHLAWCPLDSGTAEKLLSQRLEISNGKKITASELKELTGLSFSELASQLVLGRERLDGKHGFRQFFRLSPPKGGFRRSIRRQYGQGGVLGPNKELSELVQNMI